MQSGEESGTTSNNLKHGMYRDRILILIPGLIISYLVLWTASQQHTLFFLSLLFILRRQMSGT